MVLQHLTWESGYPLGAAQKIDFRRIVPRCKSKPGAAAAFGMVERVPQSIPADSALCCLQSSEWASKENSFLEKFLVAVDKVIGGATALLELTCECVPHLGRGPKALGYLTYFS
jgi:hypothetical protein